MKAALKNLAWRSSALLLIFSMLLSIVKLPLVYAYFSTVSPKESHGLSFHIYKEDDSQDINANLALPRSFLFEEEDSISTVDGSRFFSTGGLQTEKYTDIRQPYPGETVDAEITVEEDFEVEEIFIPSVKLLYEDKISFALTGEIIDAALVATFDFYIIWSWFQNVDHLPDYVTMAVSGEGYKEDDSIFFFTGETTVQLKGKFDIREVKIDGPDLLFIPPDEPLTCKYKLLDQDGSTLTGVSWALVEAVEGVSVDEKTGELSAGEEAVGETIVLDASLESQGRLHVDRKELQIYPFPQLEILGEEIITVPLPGKSISEPYELLVSHDFQVEEVAWSLVEGAAGIEVDQKGWVTVSGEAMGGSFTLTVLVDILETPFSMEKEVELEIIQIGSVQIEGDTYHITVPSSDPISIIYTAVVYSPNGEELPGEPVTWHLDPKDNAGITLTDEGELIVEPSAGTTNLVLESVSVRDPSVSGTFSVTVESAPAPFRTPLEEEMPLIIHGEDFILIPSDNVESKTIQYTATSSKDFSPDDLTWSIQYEVKGVAVDAAGLLTVMESAPEGAVILLASAQSPAKGEGEGEDEDVETELLDGRKIITLAHPAAAIIEISGAPSSITIPQEPSEYGEEFKTFQLSALVLDQKGAPIEGEIAWRLDGSPLGIDLNESGLLTVTSGAEEGFITVTASVEVITVDVSIELLASSPAEGGDSPPQGDQEKDPPAKEEDDPVIKPEEDDEDSDGTEGNDEDKDGENTDEPDPLISPDEEAVTSEKDEEDDGVEESGDADPEDYDNQPPLPEGKIEDDDSEGDIGDTAVIPDDESEDN